MTSITARPSFSLIITTFRRIELLPRVISAVRDEAERPVEIIVTFRPDDDPDTGRWLTEEMSGDPLVKPLALFEVGKVAALNAALAAATGDILVMLDDDIVIRPGWLRSILGHFTDPMVGAVGGHDIVHPIKPSSKHRLRARAGYRNMFGRIVGGHDAVFGPARETEVLKGCNWSVRRSAIGSLRFDERLLGIGAQAGDDYWFCLNLRRAGWKVILDPSAVVDHYPAYKPDYDQGTWGERKCFEWTANQTAHNLAFLSAPRRIVYVLNSVLVGVRHCPGLYFIAHSLLKRPKSLRGQLAGGWRGFRKGMAMSRMFREYPPGAARPPAALSAGHRG